VSDKGFTGNTWSHSVLCLPLRKSRTISGRLAVEAKCFAYPRAGVEKLAPGAGLNERGRFMPGYAW
jgi:hypothetical protein